MAFLSLPVLLLMWPIYVIAGDSCVHYNASGSVQVPFPQPPNLSPFTPSGNYSLSTYLSFNPASVSKLIHQNFAATNASGDPITAQKLDYQGCLLWFKKGVDSSLPSTNNHINEPVESSCSAALSSSCISKIVTGVQSTAHAYSQQNLVGDSYCSQIFPATCGQVGEFASSSFFTTNPRSQSLNTSNNCPAHTFNTDAALVGSSLSGGASNYFKHLHGATPVVIVAWNNASSNGGKPWADTRLFCITTDHVAPGSQSDASVSKQMWPAWYLAALSAGIALLVFTL